MALAQLNPTVGDLAANTDAIIEALAGAAAAGAQLAVFGELAIRGYPPEDLVLKSRCIDDCQTQVERIEAAAGP